MSCCAEEIGRGAAPGQTLVSGDVGPAADPDGVRDGASGVARGADAERRPVASRRGPLAARPSDRARSLARLVLPLARRPADRVRRADARGEAAAAARREPRGGDRGASRGDYLGQPVEIGELDLRWGRPRAGAASARCRGQRVGHAPGDVRRAPRRRRSARQRPARCAAHRRADAVRCGSLDRVLGRWALPAARGRTVDGSGGSARLRTPPRRATRGRTPPPGREADPTPGLDVARLAARRAPGSGCSTRA